MGFLPAVRGSTGRNLPLRPQSCRLQLRCLREPESWATPPPGQTADSPSPKSPRDCGNGPPVCAPPSPCGLVPAVRIFSFKVRQSPGNQPQRSCSACYSSSDFQARLPWLDAFSPRGGAAELTWRLPGPFPGTGAPGIPPQAVRSSATRPGTQGCPVRVLLSPQTLLLARAGPGVLPHTHARGREMRVRWGRSPGSDKTQPGGRGRPRGGPVRGGRGPPAGEPRSGSSPEFTERVPFPKLWREGQRWKGRWQPGLSTLWLHDLPLRFLGAGNSVFGLFYIHII